MLRYATLVVVAGLAALAFYPAPARAQGDTVRPHVVGPEEAHTSVSPMGVRVRFLVGSVSTGASQFFFGRATLPPGGTPWSSAG